VRHRMLAAAGAASVLVLAGCADAGSGGPQGIGEGRMPQLTVYADTSLKSGLDALADMFDGAATTQVNVQVIYDGSATLAAEIVKGAHADVFAAGDEDDMQTVTGAGLASGPRVFATDALVIVVPHGDPAGVASIADLARTGVRLDLCAQTAPCGVQARALLHDDGVSATPATTEATPAAVLADVADGKADAGIVFATDARTEPSLTRIVPADAPEAESTYPIAALASAEDGTYATRFVDYVLGTKGRRVLASLGFGVP
jgi:molybdate transport system substrate-binding protein